MGVVKRVSLFFTPLIWLCLNFVLYLFIINRVLPLNYRGCSLKFLYYVCYNSQT